MSVDLVEVVDFDGKFDPEFLKRFKALELLQAGLKFNVVTVLGCQSSGKSTLLNSMFGTKFPEMNSSIGRGQTTKGIWCSKDVESNTLVVDVEGTDSKERGEDRLTFEHRASLFSLAVADAVVVNMWYHDIGRYTASNYGLLKTVLAVMLELFHTAEGEVPEREGDKTVMMFILRDFDPKTCTPLAKLERSLLADVQNIWKEIKKPLSLKNTQADDFFRFFVFGLPNKLSDMHLFNERVTELKRIWRKDWCPPTYSRKVPADGFPMYAQSVWETIMSSQQLDIPSQKEMVALYRCDEIKVQAFSDIRDQLRDAATAAPLIQQCLEQYHAQAWRYESSVYAKKRQELLELIFDALQKTHDQNVNDLRQQLMKTQSEKLRAVLRKDPFDSGKMAAEGKSVVEHWSSFADLLSAWRKETVESFESQCQASSISLTVTLDELETPLQIYHSFDNEMQEQLLNEQIMQTLTKAHQQEVEAYKKYLEPEVDQLRMDLESIQLTIPKHSEYWSKATEAFLVTLDKLYAEHQSFLGSLLDSCSSYTDGDTTRESSSELDAYSAPPPKMSTRNRLACILFAKLRSNILLRIDRAPEQVHNRFKRFFEVDEAGAPNYWPSSSPDQIKKMYLAAREKALPLHSEIMKFAIDLNKCVQDPKAANEMLIDAGIDVTNPQLIPLSKENESLSVCEKYMLKCCQQAQFIQATGGQVAKASWWMWVLVLALGWNELMFVFRSPIFTISLLLAAAVLFVAWYTKSLFLLTRSGRYATSCALSAVLPLLQSFNEHALAPPAAVPLTAGANSSPTPAVAED